MFKYLCLNIYVPLVQCICKKWLKLKLGFVFSVVVLSYFIYYIPSLSVDVRNVVKSVAAIEFYFCAVSSAGNTLYFFQV